MKTNIVVIGIAAVCIVVAGALAINSTRHHAAAPTVTPVQNDASNSTNTTSPENNSVDSVNGTGGSSTGAGTSAVNSADDAVGIVTSIYASQMAKDSSLQIQFDHEETVGGQMSYIIHVFANQNNHMATVGWVAVRADGKVQNYTLRNGWVDANQYKP